jgi:LPS-assembly protein
VGGAAASVELARRYGPLEHRIVPRVELVAGTATWRRNPGSPFAAYDLWDRIESERTVPFPGVPDPNDHSPTPRDAELPVAQTLSAAPDGPYVQLRASILNTFDAGPAGRVTLELGQDADLRQGKLAESFASVAVARGPFAVDASAHLLAFGGRPATTPGWNKSWLDAFTRLHLGGMAHDARGDSVHLALDSTSSGAVGAQGAGVDALFDLRSSGAAPDAWYRAGARLALGASALEYEVRLTARAVPTIGCAAGRVETSVPPLRVVEQNAALVWDSPCHCFTARVSAGQDLCGNMTYGFSLDLSKIFQGAAPKAK